MFSLFFFKCYFDIHVKNRNNQGSTYTIQDAFINVRELLLRCAHFSKWTLDLSTSDGIISNEATVASSGASSLKFWNKKTMQIDLLSSLKLQ